MTPGLPHRLRSALARTWPALGILAFAMVGVAVWWGFLREANPPPIVLSLTSADSWKGVNDSQRRGIKILLRDHLEILCDLTVLEEEDLGPHLPAKASWLKVTANRTGNGLSLDLDWRPSGLAPVSIHVPPAAPREAFQAAMGRLGTTSHRPGPELLPADPSAFWSLAEATGWQADRDLEPTLAVLRSLSEQEPKCACTRASLAILSYWKLDKDAASNTQEAFNQCSELFARVFELIPHFPRAVDGYVGFKTDLGAPREALQVLFAALDTYPRLAYLRGALAYPARTSGLLEGARRALADRDRLSGAAQIDWEPETTYLYLGDWKRFETSLEIDTEGHTGPARLFYKGYLHLLRHELAEARADFQRAQHRPGSWVQFESLAKVYDLQLSGRSTEALEELRRLKAARARLRVPDGEFTFKFAEAFALLGEDEEAYDTAASAFAQGFGCAQWYQNSPLLARMQGTPKWKALLQHVRERQALMESAFPVDGFGPP